MTFPFFIFTAAASAGPVFIEISPALNSIAAMMVILLIRVSPQGFVLNSTDQVSSFDYFNRRIRYITSSPFK